MEMKATMVNVDGIWVVRLVKGDGKVQEYRCASEKLARQLGSMLLSKDEPVTAMAN